MSLVELGYIFGLCVKCDRSDVAVLSGQYICFTLTVKTHTVYQVRAFLGNGKKEVN